MLYQQFIFHLSETKTQTKSDIKICKFNMLDCYYAFFWSFSVKACEIVV